MGRPKRHDPQAVYRIHKLVTVDGLSIRAAAETVGKDRGYAESQLGSFVEWARKEYAAHRDAETIPLARPLPAETVKGITDLFNRRERETLERSREREEARRRAARLDIDLEGNSFQRLFELGRQAESIRVLLNAEPRFQVGILIEDGKIGKNPAEREVIAALGSEH